MEKIIEARGLQLKVHHEVYTPREDSFLMSDLLNEQQFKESYFMEIGPGSGIISLSVGNQESTVLAIDINERAARQCAENARLNRFDNFLVVASDSLLPFRRGAFPEKIIFNPPYLPGNPEIDPYSPKYEIQQLVGGEKGDEEISKVLDMLANHNCVVYTIVSSLATNPVEFANKHSTWKTSVMGTENMGFETIWVLKMENKI